jgi:hypothetical protein
MTPIADPASPTGCSPLQPRAGAPSRIELAASSDASIWCLDHRRRSAGTGTRVPAESDRSTAELRGRAVDVSGRWIEAGKGDSVLDGRGLG